VLVGDASVIVSMVVTAYLHASIPWQDVISSLSISPQISCLRRASFSRVGRPGGGSSFKACGPITSSS